MAVNLSQCCTVMGKTEPPGHWALLLHTPNDRWVTAGPSLHTEKRAPHRRRRADPVSAAGRSTFPKSQMACLHPHAVWLPHPVPTPLCQEEDCFLKRSRKHCQLWPFLFFLEKNFFRYFPFNSKSYLN